MIGFKDKLMAMAFITVVKTIRTLYPLHLLRYYKSRDYPVHMHVVFQRKKYVPHIQHLE